MSTTEPDTLESLVAQWRRAEAAHTKLLVKANAKRKEADNLLERIHELTKPGAQ